MKIEIQIDPKDVVADEARAYELAVEQFAAEWRLMVAKMLAEA